MNQYKECPYCKKALEHHTYKTYHNHDMTSPVTETILYCKSCSRELDIADWYEELEQSAENNIERAIDERKSIFVN
jgi:uncharacterized CHY-type Zn-finger protein